MGRTLKRVALDFDWPQGEVWKGYINPHPPSECSACEGSGYNAETRNLSDRWYSFKCPDGEEGWQYHLEQPEVDALIEAGRLWDFTRVPRTPEQRAVVEKKLADGGNCWLPESNGYMPTADEVNEWARRGMGHDSINQSICVKARAERLGVYGLCDACAGEGLVWSNADAKAAHDAFENFEPPIGEGFQLWETTSEGSPASPVFDSLDALAEWCAANATTFGSGRASKEDWIRMLGDDVVHHQDGNVIFL